MSFWSLCWCIYNDPIRSGPETIYKTLDDAIMAAINSVSENLYQTPDGTIWYCSPKEIKRNKGVKLKVLKRLIKENLTFDPTDPWDGRGTMTEYYLIREVKLLGTPKITPKQVDQITEWKCDNCGRNFDTDADDFDPETGLDICFFCYLRECKNDPNLKCRDCGSIDIDTVDLDPETTPKICLSCSLRKYEDDPNSKDRESIGNINRGNQKE